jgi:diacylglycerol kinase (ATP)
LSAPRVVIVVNPKAGPGVDLTWIRSALSFLGDRSVRVTAKHGDATRLAREAVEAGAELIVAAGGDGTLHEIVNGMAPDFERAWLGIVPLGTGNDTARSLGSPLRPEESLKRLRRKGSHLIDLIEVELDGERSFALNAATAGLGGVVNEAMTAELRARWGALAYARAAAGVIPEPPVRALTACIDDTGDLDLRVVSLVVANGPYAARGVRVAPGARVDDGRLDVHIILESTRAELLALVPPLLRGRIPSEDHYLTWRCEEIRIHAPEGLPVSVDGEHAEGERMQFRIRPGCLRVLGG